MRICRIIPVIRRNHRRIVAEILVLCSCSGGQHQLPRRESPVSEVPKVSTARGWSPTSVIHARHYLIQDSSLISNGIDSLQQRSIQNSSVYTLESSLASDSVTITAMIDSPSVNTHSRSLNPQSNQPFQLSLSQTGQIRFESPDAGSGCPGGVTSSVLRIAELIIGYPHNRLRVGDHWQDTVFAATCRGRILLIQQSIRSYEFINSSLDQSHYHTLIRTVLSTYSSRSTDADNQLVIKGTGSSSNTLIVDNNSGALLQSSGEGKSTFTITTSRGAFLFIQSIKTHIKTR